MTSISCVQADHNSCRCDTDHPIPENHLLGAIEGDEAGCFRFPEAAVSVAYRVEENI
jgi:hypothetical protein